MKLPATPRILSLLSLAVFLWIVYRVHSIAARDPTSVFFDPSTGYTPRYSAVRREQAAAFIARANSQDYAWTKAQEGQRRLCVGIPSMATRGPEYLQDAVGSLLEGLTEDERGEMYVVVFVPHSNPAVHGAYGQTWLSALTDHILTYNLSSPEEMKHVQEMEKEEGGEYREKGVFDYHYLLEHCAEQQAPYVAIFEDDIVAADGWFHRTLAALEEAETRSATEYASQTFLYLRLFYTEELHGWNSEDWLAYLATSFFVFIVPMGLLCYLRTQNAAANRILTNRVLLAIAASITTSIGLFFALGRITVHPLPTGISLMPEFGCCSQALVFPTTIIPSLAAFFASRRTGAPDVLLEDFARDKGGEDGLGKGLRWALSPSVVQHVGRESSKKDDFGEMSKYGMSVAETIWSFGFEDLKAGALRTEHGRVVREGS
ncbi:integral membrane protein-like protein [Lentithecium fluviatile CBS 122367]|uniref:Integral membrane protein-like protein n=1 Tax=Lentithecium fluviatile CBS 122367 TaxID=1168545 RepID=A0A6G1JDS1_9PLEO|nr:integral membrane protein-like protein [Lentithecium fluviatile CBS 122367]